MEQSVVYYLTDKDMKMFASFNIAAGIIVLNLQYKCKKWAKEKRTIKC